MIGKRNGVLFFSVRYKDSLGNTKAKFMQSKEWKTKREAKEAMDVFLLSVKTNYDKITVDQLFMLYREHTKEKIKQHSIDTQDNYYFNHIKPYLGDLIIRNISPRDILKWQNYLVSKKFSNRYSSSIQHFFRTLINFGLKYEYINRNPFKGDFIVNHEEKKEEMEIWTIDEFNRFIPYAPNLMYEAFFTVLYWSGLRKGEAAALRVEDIDFKNSQINVTKTYDFVNKISTLPKTRNSIRTVAITDNVKSLLEALCKAHKASYEYSEDRYVFGYDAPLAATTIERIKHKMCLASGVKEIRVHDLRHSHVSLLVSLGFSPIEIAKRLGHTVDMVNNVYSHLFKDSQQRMVDRLNDKANSSAPIIKA
jgi:integrase